MSGNPAIKPAATAIRLVAIDLDGTLLDDAKRVGEATGQALRSAAERGVKVVIASARPPRSVRHIYRELGLDTWQINYNGALIWDEPRRQAVFHQPMDCALVSRIIHHARRLDEQVLVTCEILDRWYTDRFEQHYTTETGRLFAPDVVAPVGEFCNQPITKLLLLGPTELTRRLEAILGQEYPQVAMVRTDDELIQIVDARVSKAAALAHVAKHYEVPLAQVMAIGDALNDVAMLQAAGLAVAMDNAHPRAKAAAHWVAPSNNHDGVHAALRRYGLCE